MQKNKSFELLKNLKAKYTYKGCESRNKYLDSARLNPKRGKIDNQQPSLK